MQICFADESGTPPKPGRVGAHQHFVIAGVIVPEAQWHGISTDLSRLRQRPEYKVVGEIKWRYFGSENTDPDNTVSHLHRSVRDDFRKEFFQIITNRKSVTIIACVTHCPSAYAQKYIQSPEDLYKFTYKVLSERFQYYLQDKSRSVGEQQLGIMVADHRGKQQDETMRHNHHRLTDYESAFSSSYDNYVETIFLTPSHLSVGIQIADMVAGAIGRAFNSNDRTCFDMIKGSFRKSANGKIEGYGLAKFPKDWV